MSKANTADARNGDVEEHLLEILRGVESAAFEATLRAMLASNEALAEARDAHLEGFQAALGRIAEAHAALQLSGEESAVGTADRREIERLVATLSSKLGRAGDALSGGAVTAEDAQGLLDFTVTELRRRLSDKLERLSSAAAQQQADTANSSKEARAIIDSAVDEIDQISLNVRLISLNASVEAARAGEAGRGFGVIASEIQNLATRSQVAVESVRRQLASIG